MEVAAIILGALVAVGAVLYIHHRLTSGGAVEETDPAAEAPADAAGEECCGMHITCEKDSLITGLDDRIEYYDDEELDRYAGRDAGSYTAEETEQFRDVLLTLLPEDIAGWARSISMRGIALPPDVRDELLMIVAEARENKTVIR